MEKVINGSKIQLALADYLATNAYINDTAQDVLVMVAKWIDEAPEVNAWIPVTERLPKTELVRYRDACEPSGYGEYYASEEFLVFATDHKIYSAKYYEGNESNWWDSYTGLDEDVTHWMPLPEPPKEVE